MTWAQHILEQLSPTEIRTFSLVIEGHSNREIAQRLKLSYHSVRNHMRSIYRSTGAKHSREVIALVYGSPELLEAIRAKNNTQLRGGTV